MINAVILNMKKNRFILTFFIIIFLFIFIVFMIYHYSPKNNNLNNLDLSTTNNVMIIAHPTDELLWGGAHLIEDNYLVVCITCGHNTSQDKEFIKVIKNTNDKYLFLGYPERTNNERTNWSSIEKSLKGDIEKVLNIKAWQKVVTHNPDGEYGNQHHKMTSKFVTSLMNNKNNLYYFGNYYSKKNIFKYKSQLSIIDEKILYKKLKLIGLYSSQNFIQTSFEHMYEHEQWQSYNEWMSENNEKNE